MQTAEQRQIELLEAESSQRQHHENLKHSDLMTAVYNAETMSIISALKPRIFIDGNKWCVLYGENIQDGIAGFGDCPRKAVRDFNSAWDRKLRA